MEPFLKVSAILVVLLSIIIPFVFYPPPPISPILYQWQGWGKYHQFGRHKIFYIDKVINQPPGSTLLCLHGFPTSSFDYHRLLPHLRKLFDRVIFIDFLGMGFSDKPVNHRYSIFEQADIVNEIVSSLKIDELHILAHDYGDTVTQEILARYKEGKVPYKIRTVSLMNGGIFTGIYKPLFIQQALRWPIIGSLLTKLSNRYAFHSTLNSIFGSSASLTQTDISDFWHIIRINNGYNVFKDILSYIDQRWENEERWISALKSAKVPLQFIYGPADPINPPPFDSVFRKLMPNPYLDRLSDDVGHYPHFEAPLIVFQKLDEFLMVSNSTNHFPNK